MRQCYQLEPMKESPESRKKVLDEEEEEDTLSLSDLSIYNDIDSEEWEKYYDSTSNSSSTSSSSSSGDEDLFEFNSEEWNKDAFAHNPPENILFCGKLIPYRINPMLENTKNKEAKTRGEKRGSILPRGKSSSRWYIFLFGLPTHEMELKDLKNRQSRKVNSASSSPSSALCPLKNGEENVGDKLYGRGKGKKKGMWGLIKALNCSGSATYEAQSVVKASIGCISLV